MSRYAEKGNPGNPKEETAVLLERLAYSITTDPMEAEDLAIVEGMLETADLIRREGAQGESDLASLFSLESGSREAHGGELCPQCLGATRVCSKCERPLSECGCVQEGENGEAVCGFDPVICDLCGGSGAEG